MNSFDNYGNSIQTDLGGTYNTLQIWAPQGLELTYVANVTTNSLLATDSNNRMVSTNTIPNVYSYDANISAAVSSPQSMGPAISGQHVFEILGYLSGVSGSGTRNATITFTWHDPTNGFKVYNVPAFTITSTSSYSINPIVIATNNLAFITNISWTATYAGSGTGTYNAKIFMRQIE
jgi:hypothetical protein